ncbi:hypothetical protein RchiOBHm_Chr3g0493271 [Rosa chinensis]|uniref:Uncharacterized protein n=1 Tax=Rosa chinensis TaxID=74649 RepID=A0A2P6RGQ4_ROSCH|nr:hypothetical protein RchiOBHm_Chr3g0493271 [Rosa chinensis]
MIKRSPSYIWVVKQVTFHLELYESYLSKLFHNIDLKVATIVICKCSCDPMRREVEKNMKEIDAIASSFVFGRNSK